MTLAWVIGSGGLLGAALVRALKGCAGELYVPAARLAWSDAAVLAEQLESMVASFAARVTTAGAWEVYWAAGIGTMGSTAAELETETSAWQRLLQLIASNDVLRATPGRIALASSAGAIYAGLRVDIIDEACPDAPTTAYARAKLEQERALHDFAALGFPVAALAARISTLYGPGQAYGKRQGLIAHMARCIVRNRPIQIFVPFDTVRDYIAADDAAAIVVEAVSTCPEVGVMTRIVASERPTSIAEIVATFRRVARRPPLIATSASSLSALYLRRVQFKSVLSLTRQVPQTALPVGVGRVLAAERLAFARG